MSEEEFRQRSPQCGDTLHAHLDIWKSGVFDIYLMSSSQPATAFMMIVLSNVLVSVYLREYIVTIK